MADTAAKKPAARKPAAQKPAAKKPAAKTKFVLLERAHDEQAGLDKAMREGRVWVEVEGVHEAPRGEVAIRTTFTDQSGAVKAGAYKSVPVSSWESDTNNEIVGASTQVVNTFSKPKKKS